MKKRGFTLIELLAVIVILAIIALIATPAVLNIIEDSRKGAAEASARNIVSAAKTYYMSETMNGRTPSNIDLSTDTLKYDGDQASKGTIIFTNGKATSKMYINGYCVEVNEDGKVTSEKKTEDECEITITPSTPELGCDTLYWDFNFEGLTLNRVYDEDKIVISFSHVSTSKLTANDLKNGYTLVAYDSTTGYNEIREVSGEDAIDSIDPDGIKSFENSIIYFPVDNSEYFYGVAFEKAGFWAVNKEVLPGVGEGSYITLTIPGYTGFEHSEYCGHLNN